MLKGPQPFHLLSLGLQTTVHELSPVPLQASSTRLGWHLGLRGRSSALSLPHHAAQ